MNHITPYVQEVHSYSTYKKHFSANALWNKISRVFSKAGIKVTYIALLLFYVVKDPNVPIADKTKIIGALGYFILPFDLVPDWIPVGGYADDLTALLWALKMMSGHITPAMRQEAACQLREWFGDFDEETLDSIWS